MNEFELRNVCPDDFISQAKGLKLVKERKRQEKHRINLYRSLVPVVKAEIKFEARKHVVQTKRQKLSDQIQRGYDIAEKWKDETDDDDVFDKFVDDNKDQEE